MHGNNRGRSPPPAVVSAAAASSAGNLIPPAFLASQESPNDSRRQHQHHNILPSHLLSERSVAGYAPSPRIRRSVTRHHNLHHQQHQQHAAPPPADGMDEEQEPQSMLSIQSGYRPQPQARSINQKGSAMSLPHQQYHDQQHQQYHGHQQQQEQQNEETGDGGDEDHVSVRDEGTQTREYATAGRSMMLRRKSGNQYFSLLYFVFHLSVSVCLLRVNG